MDLKQLEYPMTQILAYRSPEGIVLGADSRAVHYLADGSTSYSAVPKLFRLSPHVLLTTAGAGYGIALCRAFQTHVEQKGLWQFTEICYQALPFFRSELERMRRSGLVAEGRPELARVYFVIAGRDLDRNRDPFQLQLLGSEQPGEPLHVIPNTGIFAIPRQLAVEMKLFRMQQTHQPVSRIAPVIKRFLLELARTSDTVGPPLHLVVVDRNGIRTDRFPPGRPAASSPVVTPE